VSVPFDPKDAKLDVFAVTVAVVSLPLGTIFTSFSSFFSLVFFPPKENDGFDLGAGVEESTNPSFFAIVVGG
jgi:hypothetical protein